MKMLQHAAFPVTPQIISNHARRLQHARVRTLHNAFMIDSSII